MIDVVFISDLHLHPNDSLIYERFIEFIEWAKQSVKKVYILGDFFHAWSGDDSLNDWSREIAKHINSLVSMQIPVFYMHGNRDFLLGKAFADLAGWQVLAEPTKVRLGEMDVLLAHGDRYCTKDYSHQRFRKLTRNKLFISIFLSLPFSWREKLVQSVRLKSQNNDRKSQEQMDVIAESVIAHMIKCNVTTLIHGHTHKAGVTIYKHFTQNLQRYVLSDWDENPMMLCYDSTKGLHLMQIETGDCNGRKRS